MNRKKPSRLVMSPKQNIVADMECQSNAALAFISDDMTEVKEFNYMGLSDSTSTESSTISNVSEDNSIYGLSLKGNDLGSNFKETELRLGIPGSQYPEKDLRTAKIDGSLLFKKNSHSSQKARVSGQKRGFSIAMIEFSEGKFASNSEVTAMPSTENTIDFSTKTINGQMKEPMLRLVSEEQTYKANKSGANYTISSNNSGEPPAKVQVVGWPPVNLFRKNMLVLTTNNTKEEEEAKKTKGVYIKVSMDGAPYLRKVDLAAYSTYQDLSSSVKNMFSCFTLGRYGSHGSAGKEITSEVKIKNMLHGYEYVLTYEDKDGDLMLLGDVPWEMFLNTCKRLRIMNGLDVVGLGIRK